MAKKGKKNKGKTHASNSVVQVVLHENDEIALQRLGIEQGKGRVELLGAHKVYTTKVKPPRWGITTGVKVERVHKFQADTTSVAWKRYLAKEITFAQFQASGRMR